MNRKVLLIDDELLLLQNLGDFLEDSDFDVVSATNGQEGLLLLEKIKPDVVVVDLQMPIMDGHEFIQQAIKTWPNLPIIVQSGVGVIDEAMAAVRAGAWDFISKPVADMQIIILTIDQCLEKARLVAENIKYQNHLEDLVVERTQQIEKTKQQIITCLCRAASFRDNDTGLHVVRVARMSYLLAQYLGLDSDFCKTISDAAPMHDVGKIGIVDKVLLKTAKLDPDEWKHMQQHVNFGCSILSASEIIAEDGCSMQPSEQEDTGFDILSVAKKIALYHHEYWNGNGYPFGIAGEEIPIEARIVSVVDVYDAISSKRPYKHAFPEQECQDIIRADRGKHFDPVVVDAFFANLDAIIKIKQDYSD